MEAEISDSEPLNPNPNTLHVHSSNHRSTKPGVKRLILTLSVLLSFLAGLPFLLKSTEIYRSPLPFSSIDPPSPPCLIHAVFLSPSAGHDADQLASLISKEIDKRMENVSGCGRNYVVSVTVDLGKGDCRRSGDNCFGRCGEVELLGLRNNDEVFDEMLYEGLGESGKIYTVFVGVGDLREGVRVVVGKHRHAWIVGNVGENDVILLIADVFLKYFVNGGREEFVERRKGEFVPVGLDGSVVLSFSLLNANPNDWVYDWYVCVWSL